MTKEEWSGGGREVNLGAKLASDLRFILNFPSLHLRWSCSQCQSLWHGGLKKRGPARRVVLPIVIAMLVKSSFLNVLICQLASERTSELGSSDGQKRGGEREKEREGGGGEGKGEREGEWREGRKEGIVGREWEGGEEKEVGKEERTEGGEGRERGGDRQRNRERGGGGGAGGFCSAMNVKCGVDPRLRRL